MVIFLNEKRQMIGKTLGKVQGRLGKNEIFNTSFDVGKIESFGSKGGKIWGRMSEVGNVRQLLGIVAEDGTILHDKTGLKSGIVSQQGKINKTKAVEAARITAGRVEVSGDAGIVYNADGVKVGEVLGAGEDVKAYGGALMALLVNVDPKNAPYSAASRSYSTPLPPQAFNPDMLN